MKIKYISIIIMICLLFLVNGCKNDKDNENIIENIDEIENSDSVKIIGDGESDIVDEAEESSDVVIIEYDEVNGTNADVVAELMKDLVDEDGGEDETEEEEDVEVVDENQEIIIENFIGDPKDITIEEGTTVKWANMMYFKHIIIILPSREDGTYSNNWVNDLKELWHNESYEYIFDEAGKYKWGSKTKFDKTRGIVTVVSS